MQSSKFLLHFLSLLDERSDCKAQTASRLVEILAKKKKKTTNTPTRIYNISVKPSFVSLSIPPLLESFALISSIPAPHGAEMFQENTYKGKYKDKGK